MTPLLWWKRRKARIARELTLLNHFPRAVIGSATVMNVIYNFHRRFANFLIQLVSSDIDSFLEFTIPWSSYLPITYR